MNLRNWQLERAGGLNGMELTMIYTEKMVVLMYSLLSVTIRLRFGLGCLDDC